jgi:hypothetical protein
MQLDGDVERTFELIDEDAALRAYLPRLVHAHKPASLPHSSASASFAHAAAPAPQPTALSRESTPRGARRQASRAAPRRTPSTQVGAPTRCLARRGVLFRLSL